MSRSRREAEALLCGLWRAADRQAPGIDEVRHTRKAEVDELARAMREAFAAAREPPPVFVLANNVRIVFAAGMRAILETIQPPPQPALAKAFTLGVGAKGATRGKGEPEPVPAAQPGARADGIRCKGLLTVSPAEGHPGEVVCAVSMEDEQGAPIEGFTVRRLAADGVTSMLDDAGQPIEHNVRFDAWRSEPLSGGEAHYFALAAADGVRTVTVGLRPPETQAQRPA